MKTIKNWVELSRETIFQKYSHKLDKVIFRLPSGVESDYYLTGQNGHTVCVLAITSDDKVVLVKQYRPGPQKVLLELPGGGVDKEETPLQAITRELLEESGYTGDFEFVTESIHNAYSGASCFQYVAKNCRKVQEIKNDDTEFTEVSLMDLVNFRKHLRTGQLSDVNTGYLGLDFLHLL
jgi:ADP-ribose pyrophosphatase